MIFEKHLPFPRLLKKSNSFPLLFFSSLQFNKSAVPSVNIVIVLIASRLSLPFCNNARYTVHKYVLQHILSDVQTRFLLAESEGFEPPDAHTSTVFKTAAFDRSANFPYSNAEVSAFFYSILNTKSKHIRSELLLLKIRNLIAGLADVFAIYDFLKTFQRTNFQSDRLDKCPKCGKLHNVDRELVERWQILIVKSDLSKSFTEKLALNLLFTQQMSVNLTDIC